MSEKKLERLNSVLLRTGDTRSGWYAKVSRGEAPRPVKLAGGRASAWVSVEIDDYIDRQIAARDALQSAPQAKDKSSPPSVRRIGPPPGGMSESPATRGAAIPQAIGGK